MKTSISIFTLLCVLYLLFSFSIYTVPYRADITAHSENSVAGEGKLIWQKYNCQSCHQLYGLGGYLGPDLTNIYSEKGKGPAYIIGMVRAGNMQMPSFTLTEAEEKSLLQFLKSADQSGNADPRSFRINYSGMIEKQ